MKHHELATSSPNTLDRLDGIRTHPVGRRRAKAGVRQSELLADLFVWLDAELRRVLAFAGQAFGALARCSKVCALTPEPN